MGWKPTATKQALKQRARIIALIRQFFYERDILEVDTPLLASATIPDPFVPSMVAEYQPHPDIPPTTCYLQTSPEFAMKRLLAANSGSIYQLCKAFRNDHCGKFHNPEFTMLEWYHLDYDHHQLMDEMNDFLRFVLGTADADRMSYQDMFQQYVNIDPLTAELSELQKLVEKKGVKLSRSASELDKDDWLNLIVSHFIEPKLGKSKPVFVYDYPASQAALAKICQDDARVAERFEVFYKGVELANGFHELNDAKEQRKRFEEQIEYREQQALPTVPIDEKFLAALEYGLPDCAGVAVGVDRLLMIAMNKWRIKDIISFDFDHA